MNARSKNIVTITVSAFLVTAAWLYAGPLNPPAGPVTGTYKTLAEVEPRIAINAINTPGDADSLFKITQPGSYYLTGNITGVAAKHGIEIVCSGVTLDLNGFDLLGVADSLDGVSTTVADLEGIAVFNGSIRDWGNEAVDLRTLATNYSRVQGVRAIANSGNGISIGNGSAVIDCTAAENAGDGINAGTSSFFSDCITTENGGNGINAGTGCTITDCTTGFNDLNGIRASSQCVIRNNTCAANGNAGDGAGIRVAGNDARIEGNNCTGADRGIDVGGSGNIIIRNTCAGNTTDWVIVANNIYGPIIDRRIPSPVASAPAVSGTAAASTLGSTDPNANFTY
ncbi:MAG: right-handed parallel beta-helix repeat-containing protein [Planctomycetota bacterium]|nr:right-handed parallel beta-helix repeat-containing protein [Planctomycetota bacterium]